MTKFPTTIDQLSKEWLSSTLECNVSSFSAAPLGEGIGVIGLVTRVIMESDTGPKTLIAKFQSASADNRAVAKTYDMYLREYRFYSEVAASVPVRSPHCYFAAYDMDTDAFVLLLEDLQYDYRIGDQVEGCTASEAHQVIDTLAALHRNTWQTKQFSNIDLHNSAAQKQGMQMGFQLGWPVVLEKFPDLFTPEIYVQGEGVASQVSRILDKICEAPCCISHGDVRLDNIFFSDSGVALVDFQALCRSAPEHDLAYFVTQSLPDDVRKAEDWVAIYHKSLTSEGLDYSLEDCRDRYRHCALYFLCYAVVICSMLDLGNERGKRLGETLLGNSIRSMQELDTFALL